MYTVRCLLVLKDIRSLQWKKNCPTLNIVESMYPSHSTVVKPRGCSGDFLGKNRQLLGHCLSYLITRVAAWM